MSGLGDRWDVDSAQLDAGLGFTPVEKGEKFYSDDEARDDKGEWTTSGPDQVVSMPISKINMSKRGVGLTENDIMAGARSKTKGPVALWHNTEKDQYLVVDGMHRIVEAWHRGDTHVKATIERSSHSDLIVTPGPEDRVHLMPSKGKIPAMARFGVEAAHGTK